MKNKTLGIFVLAAAAFFSLQAEGNESLYDLTSPSFLGGSWDYTSTKSPHADGINPAASALNQRITLDLNYIGIGFDQDNPGWKGFNLNAGATIPTKAGVMSFSGSFRHSPAWETLNLGTQFGFHASFAKELYDNLLTGIGLNVRAGNGYAFTADLGLIHLKGDTGILKDFRWAVVLQEFGYVDQESDYPSPFSLGLGMGFTPVKNKVLTLDATISLNFPSFLNARMGFGMEFTFAERFGIQLGTRIDVKEILDEDYSGLMPSFGIFYTHKLSLSEKKLSQGMQNQGWNQSEIRINAAAAPLGNGLWAIGGGVNLPLGVIDNKPPEINIDTGIFRFDLEGREKNPSGPAPENPEAGDNADGEGDSETVSQGGFSPADAPIKVSFKQPGGGKKDASSGKGRELFLAQTGKAGDVEKDGGASDKTAFANDLSENSAGEVSQDASLSSVPEPEKPEPERGLVDSAAFQGASVVEYISPNNDGIYDDLVFPLSITDSRYIEGYALVIQDENGFIVRKIENKDERPENTGFTGFFKRLFSVKKGITIPDTVRWDGYFDDGTLAPDGKYVFYIQAWDDNGNRGYSRPLGVVVDNTPPELTIRPPRGNDLIFSPDGDGNKDELFIGLSGSREDLWTMTISNTQGRPIRTVEWRSAAISDFTWDGRDNNGNPVPDDVYHVKITSTDRAGNTTAGGFENIIVNTIPTPVGLSISSRYFSPGSRDAISQIELALSIPVKTGIVSWRLEISDSARVHRLYQGTEPPDSVLFDGKNNSGGLIPEGSYRAKLQLQYVNGSRPEALSPEFIADTTPPKAGVSLSYNSFSPNGDGQKDTIRFYMETSQEEHWFAEIRDSRNNVVLSYDWRESAPAMLDWDGSGADGRLSPDGEYSFVVFSTDRAGNKGASTPAFFELDTEDTTVFLSTDTEAFSPNGDRAKDTITFIPELKVPEGIERYSITVENENAAIIWQFNGRGNINRNPSWDGFSGDGRKAPDGRYRALIEVVYEKGDISQAASRWFVLDTVFPQAEVAAEYTLFSPDGSGFKDSIPVRQTSSAEELWTGTIVNSQGKTVREYYWQNQAVDFYWDGKDSDGNLLPDGQYRYSLSAQDKAGNKTVTSPLAFTMDTSPRVIYITAEKDGFAPNGNGVHDDIQFNILIPNKEGISAWNMVIENSNGQAVKNFTAQVIPEKIIWDGKDENGKAAADDNYRARLTVEYLKGNRPESLTTPFVVDTRAPVIDLQLRPLPFSPDNDGVDDELHIIPRLEDITGIETWGMEVYDRTGVLFKTFKGTGQPSSAIIWDGRGDKGDLVISAEDYDYLFYASDKWGNTAQIQGKIPVDVLVIREGNRLRIQIASIQFAPDSPALSEDSQEIIDRNIAVLRRLVEILKKYESYRITIEGHAASVYWQNPTRAAQEEREELQPLSKARAETVKSYLVQMGISASRINTVGRGGTEPVVPHSDVEGRWKNRRVDFLLDR